MDFKTAKTISSSSIMRAGQLRVENSSLERASIAQQELQDLSHIRGDNYQEMHGHAEETYLRADRRHQRFQGMADQLTSKRSEEAPGWLKSAGVAALASLTLATGYALARPVVDQFNPTLKAQTQEQLDQLYGEPMPFVITFAGDLVNSALIGLAGGMVGAGVAVATGVAGATLSQGSRRQVNQSRDNLQLLQALGNEVAHNPELLLNDRERIVNSAFEGELQAKLSLPPGQLEQLDLAGLQQLGRQRAHEVIAEINSEGRPAN